MRTLGKSERANVFLPREHLALYKLNNPDHTSCTPEGLWNGLITGINL
jgi:hypothetical protein